MTVEELISCLQKMPQQAEVVHIWDGAARTGVEFVWVAKQTDAYDETREVVVTADRDEVVYDDEERPAGATGKYWHTPPVGKGCLSLA